MVEDVVKEYATRNASKLKELGMNHDWAFAKALVADEVQDENTCKDNAESTPAKMPEFTSSKDEEKNDVSKKTEEHNKDDDADSVISNPWSLVCVCGIRVFTKDATTSVSIVKAADDQLGTVELVGEIASGN